MNTKAAFVSFLFSLLSLGIFAQSNAKKPHLLKLKNVGAYPSVQAFFGGQVALADFRDLAPGSALLSRDYSGYSTADFSTASASGGISLLGNFAIRNGDTYLDRSELRIGIGYSSTTTAFAERFNEERTPFDTLTSSQTGSQIFVDSMVYSSIRAENLSNFLRVNVSWIAKTDPEKMCSLYSGLGIYGAFGLSSTTTISYNEARQTISVDPAGQQLYGFDEDPDFKDETEGYANKSGFAMGAYIPLGVELRLSKSHDLLKRIGVFYELRPGVDYSVLPQLGGNARFFVQIGLGVNFTI